jgi:hypothetical protein
MYALFNIVGPILLIAVVLYATIRYWNRSRAEEARGEAGARELREELNREDQTRSEGSR